MGLSGWDTATVDAGVWASWSILVGWRGAHWSRQRTAADGWLTRLRPFEKGGDVYRRLGIRRWKRYLPDAGGFAGGQRKRPGRSRDPDVWARLADETRRAERVHWLTLVVLPVLLVFNRGTLALAMVAYAVVANGPCIAVQRYNRARLAELLGLGGARRDPVSPLPQGRAGDGADTRYP